MIFIITGTEAYPFDRLIIELDRLKENKQIKDDIYIQLGSCTYIPRHCTFDNWLPFNVMCENIRKADFVIAHAGAGTTLLCLELGKTPIIVTRQKQHNEHLDDHQIPFAKMMQKFDYAVVAYDVSEIMDCINKLTKARKDSSKYRKDNSRLINYLNSWLNS
jgi:UDP-N-acetylglucosamine transferase subunit ALG13